MKKHLLAAVAMTAIGFGFAVAPASAAPVAPLGLSALHDTPVIDVRMSRMERRRMMRQRMMMRHSRRRSPSQSGNAKDPSRSPRMQNQGMTTGGPRY